ncbi:MAG: glycosyltransferase [Phycisphaerales bacterium]
MPRATVIIPNYNNGRASSRDGQRDFLGELLASLERTLAHDPTDLEIVIADDGSTDDSLATARAWAARRWAEGTPRAGRPMVRLIELPHSGVLSKVLNAIHAATEGEFVCRLDGDVVIDTPDWVAACVALLDSDARVGVVTGLQKLPDGRVHALGDAILSPLGYHHLGQGLPESALPEVVEVEHAMGCFHASRRAAIAEVGGYDESVLRGQTEELAMRLNLAGWKALATTRVVFRHFHAERHWRPNTADTGEGLQRSLGRFREKWGCDRLAPDLAEVWRRWKDTPLVARARLSGPRAWDPAATGDLPAGAEWERFPNNPALQALIGAELAALRVGEGPIAILGARSGLSAFLRARDGVEVTAVEEHRPSVAKLEEMSKSHRDTAKYLTSVAVDDLSSTARNGQAFKIVALLDSAERYWNPVGLLREARRLLAAEGLLVVRSRARAARYESRGEALHLFAAHELLQIVRHVGGFTPLGPPTLDGTGRWQLLARSSGSTAHSLHFGA